MSKQQPNNKHQCRCCDKQFSDCDFKKTNQSNINFTRKVRPKTTIPCNWSLRNDSSNITAVLHPHNFPARPKILKEATTCKTGAKYRGVSRKCCLASNDCYCKERRIKPNILTRPKTCLSRNRDEQTLGKSATDNLSRWSLLKCVCSNVDLFNPSDDADGSGTFQKSAGMKSASKSGELDESDFSEQRKDYEDYRRAKERQLEERVAQIRQEDQVEEEEEEVEVETVEDLTEDEFVSMLYGPKAVDSKSEFRVDDFVAANGNGGSMEELRDFRREHYLETHATGSLPRDGAAATRQHTCVHQFQLDGRMLPEPVRTDSYGRSLCATCSEPMAEAGSTEAEIESTGRAAMKRLARRNQLGLAPRRVSWAGGTGSGVQLLLSGRDLDKFAALVGRTGALPTVRHADSFALRHQKMRCT